MTDPTIALMDYLRNMGLEPDEGFLQEALQQLTQTVVELEAAQQIGAGRYERTPERKTYRNGHRDRVWETRVGEIPLRIPKVRDGSYFPSLLEPRRRSEKALLAVVQQAYVEGVSTRRVDDLLQALGPTGIDKSRVSRICKELDEVVERFRSRPLEGSYPFVWLDALYLKVRHNHRIVSQALVIATGVRENGEREVLGFALGASEEEAFWLDFLRSLVRRGLKGVQLVTSDAHEGLKKALGQVLAGVSWQRCRVHFMRNLLAHVPRGDKSMVASALRTIFAQPDRQAAGVQLAEVVKAMHRRWPPAAELLAKAEDDILAYMVFPPELWTRINSTNPLERLNKEVKRRTNVVGIFPNGDSATTQGRMYAPMGVLVAPSIATTTTTIAYDYDPLYPVSLRSRGERPAVRSQLQRRTAGVRLCLRCGGESDKGDDPGWLHRLPVRRCQPDDQRRRGAADLVGQWEPIGRWDVHLPVGPC